MGATFMASATVDPSQADAGASTWMPYRMTAEEYFRAVDADVFLHERRIELWEGWIQEKKAKQLVQAVVQAVLCHALFRVVPRGWSPWLEAQIHINDFTAPLPELAIIRGDLDDYCRRDSFPNPNDIGLVVELAETSVRKHLNETLRVYAQAGLPCYWVVNFVAGRVEVYSQPRVESEVAMYSVIEMFDRDKDVPLVLDDQEVARIPVCDLLPGKEPR
jgi:hypothetical protein